MQVEGFVLGMKSHVSNRLVQVLDPNLVCAFIVLSILSFPVAVTVSALVIGHVDFFRFQYAIRVDLCLHLFTQALLCDISKTSIGIYACDEFTQVLWPAITLRHRPQDERLGWVRHVGSESGWSAGASLQLCATEVGMRRYARRGERPNQWLDSIRVRSRAWATLGSLGGRPCELGKLVE